MGVSHGVYQDGLGDIVVESTGLRYEPSDDLPGAQQPSDEFDMVDDLLSHLGPVAGHGGADEEEADQVHAFGNDSDEEVTLDPDDTHAAAAWLDEHTVEVEDVDQGHGEDSLAMRGGAGGETLQSFMARVQLKHFPAVAFPRSISCSSSGAPLGRVHVMWGKTFKATCKMHAKCSLMLEKHWFPDPELVVYRWFAMGKFATAAEHAQEGAKIVRAQRGKDARSVGSKKGLLNSSYVCSELCVLLSYLYFTSVAVLHTA